LAELAQHFDDSAGYERFMGRWSRAVGDVFLDWVAAPANAQWLDVGCGTGIFTELILNRCSPAAVFGMDPAKAQIDHVRQPTTSRANFAVGDSRALPFRDASFDVIASALVINFISDRPCALCEMRRVARAGALVAGYVWDFAGERSPSWPIRVGLRRMGVDVPGVPGTNESKLNTLTSLFELAGFENIDTRSIEVAASYSDFDDFLQAQTPSYNPITKTIDGLSVGDRRRLIETVRAALPVHQDGRIEYSARANAVKGRAPA
jgi:SAM-dependent methyltransferase